MPLLVRDRGIASVIQEQRTCWARGSPKGSRHAGSGAMACWQRPRIPAPPRPAMHSTHSMRLHSMRLFRGAYPHNFCRCGAASGCGSASHPLLDLVCPSPSPHSSRHRRDITTSSSAAAAARPLLPAVLPARRRSARARKLTAAAPQLPPVAPASGHGAAPPHCFLAACWHAALPHTVRPRACGERMRRGGIGPRPAQSRRA